MNRLALTFLALFALAGFAYAGPEPISGKEMKQVVPPPCPEWYGDTEWNVALWGAYAFGGSDDVHQRATSSLMSFTLGDTIAEDGAYGGGIDVKYFFHRYFGVGIEGFALVNQRNVIREERAVFEDNDNVEAVKGTFTIRYPFHCSRFAPYIYAGGGVIFPDRQRFVDTRGFDGRRDDDDPRACGEVGGGLEFRITRHIGWITDVSWNFNENDNFGMVRSGVNFAF